MRQSLPWLVMVVIWACVFGHTIIDCYSASSNPTVINDDARIVTYSIARWKDPFLFTNDVLGIYHLDGTSDLYRGLFYLVAQVGDPYRFSQICPFILFPIFLAGIGVTANRIGGRIAAFVAITLLLGSAVVFGRMFGALPRAFACPILAWIAACLTLGRVRAAAVLVVVGAGFYPVVTVVGGLALAIVLLVMPPEDRGEAEGWSLRKRMGVLVLTAVACAAMTAPFAWRMHAYGDSITPSMVREYPEAGPGGRMDATTAGPFPPFVQAAEQIARYTVGGAGYALVPWLAGAVRGDPELRRRVLLLIFGLSAAGYARFFVGSHRGARRFMSLLCAVMIAYPVANWLTPRLVVPQRYVQYVIPIIVSVGISSAFAHLIPRAWMDRRPRWWRLSAVPVLLFGGFVLGCFGTRGHAMVGLRQLIQADSRPLYSFLSHIPKKSLVAGWPDDMDNVPLVSHRTVLLSRELHMPYHTEMTLLMRRRMEALMSAYFASNVTPLKALRDQFQVTHLVVRRDRLLAPKPYFRPFTADVFSTFSRNRRRGFEVERQVERAAVFKDKTYFVLELDRIQ